MGLLHEPEGVHAVQGVKSGAQGKKNTLTKISMGSLRTVCRLSIDCPKKYGRKTACKWLPSLPAKHIPLYSHAEQ